MTLSTRVDIHLADRTGQFAADGDFVVGSRLPVAFTNMQNLSAGDGPPFSVGRAIAGPGGIFPLKNAPAARSDDGGDDDDFPASGSVFFRAENG